MSTDASPARSGMLVILTAGAVFATMAMVNQLPFATQKTLLAEGGLFETLSVVGYALCIACMLLLWGLRTTLAHWYFPVLLALFAGRELDLDKRPFTEGLLKSRQYIGDTVPAGERAISAIILLGVIATVLTLLWRETRGFVRGLFARSPAAFAVLTGVLFIGVYKAIDGLARKLAPFGINISDSLNQTIAVIEEIGELGIPLMFGIAIYLSATQKQGRT